VCCSCPSSLVEWGGWLRGGFWGGWQFLCPTRLPLWGRRGTEWWWSSNCHGHCELPCFQYTCTLSYTLKDHFWPQLLATQDHVGVVIHGLAHMEVWWVHPLPTIQHWTMEIILYLAVPLLMSLDIPHSYMHGQHLLLWHLVPHIHVHVGEIELTAWDGKSKWWILSEVCLVCWHHCVFWWQR